MSAADGGRLAGSETLVVGYCVHCRTRRHMQGAIQVCNKRGRHDLKGHCAACGRSMYRLGGWESVAAAAHEDHRAVEAQDRTQL